MTKSNPKSEIRNKFEQNERFDPAHPGGMGENSPAFQRWDLGLIASSPEGTAESAIVGRPFGTYTSGRSYPALKRWAILGCPSGTVTRIGLESLVALNCGGLRNRCTPPHSLSRNHLKSPSIYEHSWF
jgi:hypothetical protein